MKVLDYGSLNYDFVYEVDHIVVPGETETSTGRNRYLGGKGLNQAIALARAGVDVYLAGQIGNDGEKFLEVCQDAKINTDYIKQIEGPSGHAIIQLDKTAQNSILLFGGANTCQKKEWIDEVLSDFGEEDILLLQNEINELPYLIEKAYSKGMTIVLNPSPFNENLEACDWKKVSIFLINEIEGFQLTGEHDPEKILEKMEEKFPDSEVVLTLGKQGAVHLKDKVRTWQDCYRIDVVDTTAAGDTFTGYFIAGKMEGLPIKQIMEKSAKASAITCSKKGATVSIPFWNEVEVQ